MSSRPFAAPHFRTPDGRHYRARAAGYQYTPIQVCQAYGIPIDKFDGTGGTLGYIELGGAFSQSDLSTYLQKIGVRNVQMTVVGSQYQQSDPGGANEEVMLDTEVGAAIAPGGNHRCYFGPNTSAGFVSLVEQAASSCDVISISWGAPEDQWTTSDMDNMNAVCKAAANAGINIFVAAGDNGSSDGESGLHADFPSSCPYVIGCGGTTLKASGSQILSEVVWNDGASGGATGGGFSSYFAKPAYQVGAVSGNYRGVPDICAVADPATGLLIYADGQMQTIGGTSGVAPLWAGITLLAQQANGGKRLGFLNPLLYKNPNVLRDILTGSN